MYNHEYLALLVSRQMQAERIKEAEQARRARLIAKIHRAGK